MGSDMRSLFPLPLRSPVPTWQPQSSQRVLNVSTLVIFHYYFRVLIFETEKGLPLRSIPPLFLSCSLDLSPFILESFSCLLFFFFSSSHSLFHIFSAFFAFKCLQLKISFYCLPSWVALQSTTWGPFFPMETRGFPRGFNSAESFWGMCIQPWPPGGVCAISVFSWLLEEVLGGLLHWSRVCKKDLTFHPPNHKRRVQTFKT